MIDTAGYALYDAMHCDPTEDYETWLPNTQCYANVVEYDGDDIKNPFFENKWLAGTYTLAECMEQCESTVDSHGRSCVAMEFADRGFEVSADTEKKCGLMWACDTTDNWSDGSVIRRKGLLCSLWMQ